MWSQSQSAEPEPLWRARANVASQSQCSEPESIGGARAKVQGESVEPKSTSGAEANMRGRSQCAKARALGQSQHVEPELRRPAGAKAPSWSHSAVLSWSQCIYLLQRLQLRCNQCRREVEIAFNAVETAPVFFQSANQNANKNQYSP